VATSGIARRRSTSSEPARRGNDACHRAGREAGGHQLAHEPLEIGARERGEGPRPGGGEAREQDEVASVAFERVIGEATLHTQVQQVGVDQPMRGAVRRLGRRD
jgi:hypothetical protein